MKAITIKQPWASLIVEGIKDIENRTWKCPEKHIGQRVLLHASKTPDKINLDVEGQATVKEIKLLSALNRADEDDLYGCIIGSVEIVDCVINHPSVWAEHSAKKEIRKNKAGVIFIDEIEIPVYNWVLANPILFPEPIPAKGKLSFWESDIQICYKTNIPCKFNCQGLCKESF